MSNWFVWHIKHSIVPYSTKMIEFICSQIEPFYDISYLKLSANKKYRPYKKKKQQQRKNCFLVKWTFSFFSSSRSLSFIVVVVVVVIDVYYLYTYTYLSIDVHFFPSTLCARVCVCACMYVYYFPCDYFSPLYVVIRMCFGKQIRNYTIRVLPYVCVQRSSSFSLSLLLLPLLSYLLFFLSLSLSPHLETPDKRSLWLVCFFFFFSSLSILLLSDDVLCL